MAETHTCVRTGCRVPAAASLSFRYASRQVWMSDPTEDAAPSSYALCVAHADGLTVPRGWERIDERALSAGPPDPPPGPPPGPLPDPDPRAAHRPPPELRRNRYAALLADLPRVAAEHHVAATAPPTGRYAKDAGPWAAWSGGLLLDDPIPQVEGQLAMPVDPDAIVVPIELAGARRRGG